MKITVNTSNPPVVEIDTESRSAYVRFLSTAVARTIEPKQFANGQIVTIDLDSKGRVVGIELIGVEQFNIEALLVRVPMVTVKRQLLEKVRYVAVSKVSA